MKSFTTALALAPAALAFPAGLNIPRGVLQGLNKRADNASQAASQAQTNCGHHICDTFSESQLVSTSGDHAYAKPAPDEIRGPCPGLNAAANHGYLPRSGLATIPETIQGMYDLYGMSADLAGFLAVYAIIFDGDIASGTWSIGGPLPNVGNNLLGYPPQGISYSHNKYEGDTSIGRNDAYLNNGDAHSLEISRFKSVYDRRGTEDRYTMDKFRQEVGQNQYHSIQTNPYYFAPLFSTTLVVPAAYNFVINFMSNHSAEEPAGYLDGAMFKQFFAVTGDDDNLEWIPGQEQIPDQWYKRPVGSEYDIPDVFFDLIQGWAAYPDTFRFGGNTNGVNSYQGVDVATFSAGQYHGLSDLSEGNNLACLLFETQQQFIPDELKGVVNDIAGAVNLFQKYVGGPFAKFGCSQLAQYDNSVFNQYPGRTYSPTGPATNY